MSDKRVIALQETYFKLMAEVTKRRKAGARVLPEDEQVLRALDYVSDLSEIKVIIIGQDPYPTPGHANGLAFSVNKEVSPLPPTLQNIFSEIETDVGVVNTCGDLEPWAKQGVILLNRILTVEAEKPKSHGELGWKRYTEMLIKYIDVNTSNLVFILWGQDAHILEQFVNTTKHCILKAPHPSPLAARRGFFGCKHFSKCNEYLRSIGKSEIDWRT